MKAALIALAALSASPAAAQMVCKPRDALVLELFVKFGETQQSFGLQKDAKVLEVFASGNGSWTAFVTTPDGRSCVVASGQAWTALPMVRGEST